MVAFVFVHGTGVRRPAYEGTLELLRKRLGTSVPSARVHHCYWGDDHGVRPQAGEAWVPTYGGAPSAGFEDVPVASEDHGAVMWGVLYEDPLAVLRQLGGADGPRPGGLVLGDRSGPELERRARALASTPPPELEELLTEADILEPFAIAVSTIMDTAVCRVAVDRMSAGGELPAELARAFVARVLGEAQRAGEPVLWSTEQRDAVVGLVSGALGGEARGVGLFLLGVHGWAAHRFGVMRAVDKRRGTLMNHMELPAGDILRYLVRGNGLRDFIAERVTEVSRREGPVVLVAHSLGGVASVDLLARETIPGVQHLVTIGSQVGYLYKLDALPSLGFGEPLPGHFPQWTNLYDRRDLLAFDAEPLFPGRVRDVEVSSGEPFPAAHSAYFANPAVHWLLARIAEEPE